MPPADTGSLLPATAQSSGRSSLAGLGSHGLSRPIRGPESGATLIGRAGSRACPWRSPPPHHWTRRGPQGLLSQVGVLFSEGRCGALGSSPWPLATWSVSKTPTPKTPAQSTMGTGGPPGLGLEAMRLAAHLCSSRCWVRGPSAGAAHPPPAPARRQQLTKPNQPETSIIS